MQYHLTKEGLEELKKELEYLKKEGRIGIAERLKRAKEYGDLSENSEYTDAKEVQSLLEGRIFELEQIIRNVIIIKKSNQKEKVSIGSTVEVEKSKKIFRYTIVGSKEAKPEENLISNESPLGKAFLNKRLGEIVEIETPAGKTKYKIVKIE
ncbi:transcription elongation factor GreA [Candidatus Wolfebacteria bacterium CG03_land_8_20_14_0_80_40_12]|uniref:Transcription elongation factor GreA n=1 Tax=Candidatus Wolfebacteria bacterium CG03_land_8_20_14_0_80_40_12 TaxID=1975069 RepID=A0A2M7B6B7_9BACT|nr:MAG: transcription elongation factor GreA [Candidatus Wolfebacteria bacterium CG03_land_8_20_14_0_80_40_12]